MAAPLPAANLANLLTLPARHFSVVDAGRQRARLLHATVSRGRPRVVETEVIDAHEEGFTTPEELYEELRGRLRDSQPEAVVLVLPQYQVLRHHLDLPAGNPTETRALVEREASHIGGLSDSTWVFDAVRLPAHGTPSSSGPGLTAAPVAAAFCRQADLEQLLGAYVEDERLVFDVLPGGDALAAAFHATGTGQANAILIDLGAAQTTVTVVAQGQTVSATSFPSGSEAFTAALAAARGSSRETAEVLKRTEPPDFHAPSLEAYRTAALQWIGEVERTIREWEADNLGRAGGTASWPVYLAGGGALQPGLAGQFSQLGPRKFQPWPTSGRSEITADFAIAWGALLLALRLGPPSPALLPPAGRAHWKGQRLWRALLSVNLALIAMLAVALFAAAADQQRRLDEKALWKRDATTALQHARELRVVAEGLNHRFDAFRPVLQAQRQTVETLQIFSVLQRQRTNSDHWYVLLADADSYATGSNHFAPTPPPRMLEPRRIASPVLSTNLVPLERSFIAEVCLVPEGERMRQALSDLVGELKRYPLFRNVDILPAERRRSLVATNLVFADRHFALEFNLSEAELLPQIPLPRLVQTNPPPRSAFRTPVRSDANGGTNLNSRGRGR